MLPANMFAVVYMMTAVVFASTTNLTLPSSDVNKSDADASPGKFTNRTQASPVLRGVAPGNPNETQHGHNNHGDGGIHVASWRWDYVEDPFVYTAFIIVAGMCKIGFHHANFLSSIIPESCLLIMLGTAVGTIAYFTKSVIVPEFKSDTFFLYLLPPIVLESAYSLHDRAFFSNLGTVLLYAVVGTLLNCFTIGPTLFGLYQAGAFQSLALGAIECLIFSALISAVDPVAVLAIFQEVGVNKSLYFLVFGESLLNDAVTVVLYTMMVALAVSGQITAQQIGLGISAFLCVSLGALTIGIFMGLLTALVTKFTTNVRVVEPLAMLGIAYLSYLLAEMVHFSGIISIIGCGIMQAQYARRNISEKSYITVKYFSKMLSAICDTIIFLYLGIVLVNDQHRWHTGFIFAAAVICFVYRFAIVFLLTFIANSFERARPINLEEQFIMAYGGLRGAVAFSLAVMLQENIVPNKNLFITATLFIILFTVCIQGGTIKPLVSLLKIRTQTGKTTSLFIEVNNKIVDSVMVGIEEITGDHGDNHWMQVIYHYNDKYIKRWLLRNSVDDKLARIYAKMVLEDHYAHLYGPATVIEEKHQLSSLMENSSDIRNMNNLDNFEDDDICERKPLKADDEHPSENAEPSNGMEKRRNTVISIFAPSIKRRQTPEDSASELLRKAFRHNPYNKYHQKYNPNLVDEDDQEIVTHLRARRIRARRLTLAALHSLSATEDEDIPEEGKEENDEPHPRAQSVSVTNPTNVLLEKAYRRRSLMSGKRPRLERAKTINVDSPPDDNTANTSSPPVPNKTERKATSLNLGTISEEENDAHPSNTRQLRPKLSFQRSITFDLTDNDETPI